MLKKYLPFLRTRASKDLQKSKKKLFIHAGTLKTGSSFFQKTIYSHRKELAQAGILYPETGLGLGTGHNEYAHRLLGINLISGKDNSFPRIVQELVNRDDIYSGLISYEGFCHPTATTALSRVWKCTKPVETHGLIVFRPHLDQAFSIYREACQHLSFQGSLKNIIQGPTTPTEQYWHATLKYKSIVNSWKKLVGRPHLHLFAFEKIKPSLVEALMKTISSANPAIVTENEQRNPSLSAPCAELMRQINRAGIPSKPRHQIAYRLHKVDKALPHLATFCELPYEEALSLEHLFMRDRRFMEKYGFTTKDLTVGEKWKWGTETNMKEAIKEVQNTFLIQLREEGRDDLTDLVQNALS